MHQIRKTLPSTFWRDSNTSKLHVSGFHWVSGPVSDLLMGWSSRGFSWDLKLLELPQQGGDSWYPVRTKQSPVLRGSYDGRGGRSWISSCFCSPSSFFPQRGGQKRLFFLPVSSSFGFFFHLSCRGGGGLSSAAKVFFSALQKFQNQLLVGVSQVGGGRVLQSFPPPPPHDEAASLWAPRPPEQ